MTHRYLSVANHIAVSCHVYYRKSRNLCCIKVMWLSVTLIKLEINAIKIMQLSTLGVYIQSSSQIDQNYKLVTDQFSGLDTCIASIISVADIHLLASSDSRLPMCGQSFLYLANS